MGHSLYGAATPPVQEGNLLAQVFPAIWEKMVECLVPDRAGAALGESFGGVERLIGFGDHGFVVTSTAIFGNADTHGDSSGVTQSRQYIGVLDFLQDLFGCMERAFDRRCRQYDSEFVSAAAKNEVGVADRLLKSFADLCE